MKLAGSATADARICCSRDEKHLCFCCFFLLFPVSGRGHLYKRAIHIPKTKTKNKTSLNPESNTSNLSTKGILLLCIVNLYLCTRLMEFATSSVVSLANDRAVAVILAFLLRRIEICRKDILRGSRESSGGVGAPSSWCTGGATSYSAGRPIATA
jgi:hypothetical protein